MEADGRSVGPSGYPMQYREPDPAGRRDVTLPDARGESNISSLGPDREFLGLGSRGPAVSDLHRRLRALSLLPAIVSPPPPADRSSRRGLAPVPTGWDHAPSGATPSQQVAGQDAEYDSRTEAAIRTFQAQRGLRVDGACGAETWAALVEAGYRLGDRLLYLRRPALRGDDVAELQRRLAALGFDLGRIDGIFGDRTAAALGEFQRNVGLPADGICGIETVSELQRLKAHTSDLALIPTIRERERLRRAPRTLTGRRVALGHHGELGAAVESLRRQLIQSGAQALALLHPEGPALAAQANAVGADVYLGLALDPRFTGAQVAFYSGYRQESAGGHRLAELLGDALADLFLAGEPVRVVGMSVPELRETRMTAVVCDIHSPELVVERAPELGTALQTGLVSWSAESWD